MALDIQVRRPASLPKKVYGVRTMEDGVLYDSVASPGFFAVKDGDKVAYIDTRPEFLDEPNTPEITIHSGLGDQCSYTKAEIGTVITISVK